MQRASDPSSLDIQKKEDDSNAEAAEAALNQQLAKAVAKGLSYFGAGPVVESLVYILELEHSIDLNSLTNNLDALRAALTKMFGTAGYTIEGKIAESLGKQLGVDVDGKSLDSLVKILRERIQEFIPANK
ncbi:MAG TPA: hypothetical protein VN739_00260 [Nitrososphaerales archaeon]|nr:hypothetical protein [Nitrososphaerales archaeon]